MAEHFGEHVTIDGYGGDEALLNDGALVTSVLSELPALLGMHILTDPKVVSAPGNDHKDPGGWSGFVMITESHISVHTFPKRGFVSADIYTCRNGLDPAYVEQYFRETFKLMDIEINFIKRGMRYPEHNIV
jgi:S-adenosylmethionine decarboxylase